MSWPRNHNHMDPDMIDKARSMVRYIYDDREIARYLGFPLARIEEIRRNTPKGEFYHQGQVPANCSKVNIWIDKDERDRRKAAEKGSAMLRDACLAYFAKHHPREAA